MKAAAVAPLLLALAATGATAHPVDEVVQGAYLAFEPTAIRLELDISPGPAVAGAILRDLDANADRVVSRAEARAYGGRVLRRLRLTVNGATLAWRLDQVGVPPYVNLEGQADTIRIFAVAPRQEQAGTRTLSFGNDYRPAASVVTTNIFPHPSGPWRYTVIDQRRSDDGRRYQTRIVTTR